MWKTLRDLRDAFVFLRGECGGRKTLVLVAINLLGIVLAVPVLIVCFPFWVLGHGYHWASNILRGVGIRRDDPIFGSVIYAGKSTWLANCAIDALGGSYEISVSGSRHAGPDTAQQRLFQAIMEHQHELRQQVEGPLFQEYQYAAAQWNKLMDEVSAGFAAINRELIPNLEVASQVWTLLSDGCIEMQDQPGCFWIGWNCEWDLEHGLRATFVDWNFDGIDEG